MMLFRHRLPFSRIQKQCLLLGVLVLCSQDLPPALAADPLPPQAEGPATEAVPQSDAALPLGEEEGDLKDQASVTRAEMAQMVVESLRFPTLYYSEFPFFRDVPLSHPAYVPIEVLRERGFVTGFPGGYYRPEQPVHFLEIYVTLAHEMGGQPPTDDQVVQLLSPFEDREDIPEAAQPAVARLIQEGVIPLDLARGTQLMPEGVMKESELKVMLSRLQDKMGLAPKITDRESERLLPPLPVGLKLVVTPTGAIIREKLTLGESVYFITTQPAQLGDFILPRGTRMKAMVEAISDESIWTLGFHQAATPAGQSFRMDAFVRLAFPKADEQAFIIPGHTFEMKVVADPENMPAVIQVAPLPAPLSSPEE